jgi:hypothetical protein
VVEVNGGFMKRKAAAVCALVLLSSMKLASGAPENSAVTQALYATRDMASRVSSDISTLDFIAFSTSGAAGNVLVLDSYRQHIEELRNKLALLESMRPKASSVQLSVLDRIVPVTEEFAARAEQAIRITRTAPDKLNTAGGRRFLKLNADLADELSSLIHAWVDYGDTKAELEHVGELIGIAPGPASRPTDAAAPKGSKPR